MRRTLYEIIEDIEVSISSGTQKDFSFRSSLKEIDFDFSIIKYKKTEAFIETIQERKRYSALNLSDKISIPFDIKITDPETERLEVHFIFREDDLNPKRFCFDLGPNWINGGRFYIRRLLG